MKTNYHGKPLEDYSKEELINIIDRLGKQATPSDAMKAELEMYRKYGMSSAYGKMTAPLKTAVPPQDSNSAVLSPNQGEGLYSYQERFVKDIFEFMERQIPTGAGREIIYHALIEKLKTAVLSH